jgi:hypothetical protein
MSEPTAPARSPGRLVWLYGVGIAVGLGVGAARVLLVALQGNFLEGLAGLLVALLIVPAVVAPSRCGVRFGKARSGLAALRRSVTY